MKKVIVIALLIIGGIAPSKAQDLSYWGELINLMVSTDTVSTSDSVYVLGELTTVSDFTATQIKMYQFENGEFWRINFTGNCLHVIVGAETKEESRLADLYSYKIWSFFTVYAYAIKLKSIDVTINFYDESCPGKLNSLRFLAPIGH